MTERATISFREYHGLTGDLQMMLIAETSDGRKATTLFNHTSFRRINKLFAMAKLLYKLEKK